MSDIEREAFERIERQFTSGNSVSVDRASVRKEDWEAAKKYAARQAPASGELVAWMRFTSTGGFEGPLADCQIDEARKRSGAWTPLYIHPHAKVPEDVIVAARGYLLSDWPYDWSSVDRAHAVKVLANRGLLTTPTPATTPEAEWVKMDDEVRWILGRPNFSCVPIAQYLRSQGKEIQTKAEDEQAEAILWMLNLYLKHGSEWRQKATELLSEATPPQEQ